MADAGYGDTTPFREALTAAGLAYVVGVEGETTVWRPGQAPLPPKPWQGGPGARRSACDGRRGISP